ncbi:MAG: CDP-diacylglycerol--glycerol-3-phosphate 3-phosphatidyltransferase [Proteobacteria bacterium]|nr:MAG: CDP-diacylglycerol--glycerol-3-phosphate 3-phosphatidyltransferase [Pseudomonadota bacterium]
MTNKLPDIDADEGSSVDALTFDTPPNRLTVLRMIAVPGVVYFLSWRTFQGDLSACVLFSLAAITDWFDGYLARAYKSVTIFGKLMDPLADKFLVVSTLIMLQHLSRIHPYLVMVLICREMGITSLRALASSEGVIIAAGKGGKYKAALQMVAIPFLILQISLFGVVSSDAVGTVLMYASVALSLSSASTYAIDFFRGLKEKRRLKQQKP